MLRYASTRERGKAVINIETPTMRVVSALLEKSRARQDLRTYLTGGVREMVERRKSDTHPRVTWDDLVFEIRLLTGGRDRYTGERVVRESVRSWALRYGITDPTPAEADEEATERPAA